MKRHLVMKPLVLGLGSAALALGLFVPRDARALELGTPASQHPYRSAQHFAFEIRVSPYRPQVDDDPSLRGQPYARNFGTSPRLMLGLELDWQALRIPFLGTLGVGVGVGSVSMSRTVQTASGRTSGDETSLSIYPFWGGLVLRGDVLWHERGFPLVPYAKAGLGMAFWRAANSAGTATQDNISGKGTSWGTNLALGAALALDSLDPGASRDMDNATGINSTCVFLEAYWLTLDGIGQSNALRVGTATWATGLAFEF